jgi:hypothetical protein
MILLIDKDRNSGGADGPVHRDLRIPCGGSAGKLRAAAAELGVAPAAISQAIRTLAAREGLPLFQRTIRRTTLSEVGNTLSARLRPAPLIWATRSNIFASCGRALRAIRVYLPRKWYYHAGPRTPVPGCMGSACSRASASPPVCPRQRTNLLYRTSRQP